MDIDEIKKLRKEIEQAKEKWNETMYDVTESMEILRDQAEKLNELDSQLSEEEFARWTEIGFRVGAKFRIDCSDVAQPVTVTGISSEGFIITAADGTKYPIQRRYLKMIDRFHVLEAAEK